MLRVLLVLGLLVAGVSAESGQAYHGPPPVKEVFNYNDRSYFLYSERVSWDEAFAICKSNDGSLAAPDDSPKAAFLSQSIAEAWAPFEDMWIGGQRGEAKGWQWASLNPPKSIPERSRQDVNMTFMYPPWVDGSIPERYNRDCLAIDRNGHSDPFFIDLECKMPRPFICEQVHADRQNDPVAGGVVTIFDSEYILYHGRLSWEGAVAFCRTNGYSLASVKNLTVAHKLAVAMLKSRPEFEDVWVGGQFKGDHWVWVSDSEEMAVSETYPPWAHPPKKGKNCVLFDRHLCDEPKFLDVKCNRVRDFVCQRRVEEEATEPPKDAILRYRKKLYTIHAGQLTWDEAKLICEDSEGSVMLELEDVEEVNFLMQAMADNKQEIDHVWLGGKLVNDEWMWVYNNSVIPPADESGYPPWCDNEKIPDMGCLNMDRQNHLTPLLYGLECNVTQGVICVQEAVEHSFRMVKDDFVVEIALANITNINASWITANKFCKEEVGYLLTNLNEEQLKQVASAAENGRYLIGAKVQSDGTAVWANSPPGTPCDLKGLPPYHVGKECLVLNIRDKSIAGLEGISCTEVNSNINYMCSSTCIKQFPDQSSEWRCDWYEGRLMDERTLGKRCWRLCPENQVVQGSNKLVCGYKGWLGAHDSPAEPTCVETRTSLEFVKPQITPDAGAIFIIDNSARVSEDDFNVLRYLVGALVSLFKPDTSDPTKKLHFHLILLNDSATSIVPLNGDKPCDIVAQINQHTRNEAGPDGRRDFNQAFYDAYTWLEGKEHLTLFFVTGGENQGEAYRENLRNVKKIAKTVVSVGFNHYKDEELSDIATVKDGKVNMVLYKNSVQLKEAVDGIYPAGACDTQINELKKNAETVARKVVAPPKVVEAPPKEVEEVLAPEAK
uniref:C-type lectin n=1 Tax=Timema bartmani TaxID=61472 RepID=A0A7R9EYH4_9NEOP|nr:unnamed protein product [Timema bartmani]